MIEVIPAGNGFRWRWIAACGRVLIDWPEHFPCTFTAFASARAYRVSFWGNADRIDHRQARCV